MYLIKDNICYIKIPGTGEIPRQFIKYDNLDNKLNEKNNYCWNPDLSDELTIVSKIISPFERVYNIFNDKQLMKLLPIDDEIKSSFSNFVRFLYNNKEILNDEPELVNSKINSMIGKMMNILLLRPQLYYLSSRNNYVNVDLLIKDKITDEDNEKLANLLGIEKSDDDGGDEQQSLMDLPNDYMVAYDNDSLIKMIYITYYKDFNQFDFDLHKVPPSHINYPIKDKTPIFTLITPTVGNPSLINLKKSLQYESIPFIHLILWDTTRVKNGLSPKDYRLQDERTFHYEFTHPYHRFPDQRNDVWLRAVGANLANTPFIGFFDDDTWADRDHLKDVYKFMTSPKNKKIDYTFAWRRMWEDVNNSGKLKLIGDDKFESIGEPTKFGYRLIDNSSIYLKTNAAWALSQMFMSFQKYGDDRLTYDFMEKNGFNGKCMSQTLINHIAKQHLVPYFKENCDK